MRNLGLNKDYEWFDQLSASKIEKVPVPQSKSEKEGVGQIGSGSPPVLPDFYLANSTLRNIYVFRAESRDPFNTFTSGSIHTDTIDIVHSYVSKIQALLEKQI